jgi:aminocarboxymuconate-semialdehyde decarboxylase
MIVDVHAHVIVSELLRDKAPRQAWRPSVRRDKGAQVVELAGRAIRSAVAEFVDPAGILAAADRAGIDRVVLSPWVPLLFPEASAHECLRRCRIQNDALAALVGDRLSALGAVPLQDAELAARELGTLMDAGVLAGVEVPASVGGAYLGDERFAPFWTVAEATGAVVFVHPTTRGFDVPVFGDFYLWNTIGNPFETTITAAHMVMAGVLERHPDLRVVLAHGGGALPALRGRLRHAHTFQPQARALLGEDPEASMRRLYFDTVTHDPALLRALVEFAGPDRVMLGTDHPFDMADPHPVATVRAAGLGADTERAVLGGTATTLLETRRKARA